MEITYQHHSPHIDITTRFKKYKSQDEEIQYISLLKGLFFKWFIQSSVPIQNFIPIKWFMPYHYSSSNSSSLFFHSYILPIFYEFGITYSYAPLSHSIYFMHTQNVITLSLSLFFSVDLIFFIATLLWVYVFGLILI